MITPSQTKPMTENDKFSMFEVVVALVVVVFGVFGVVGLIPVGLDSNTVAMGVGSSADAAEQFFRYNTNKIKHDWTWIHAFANEKPGSDEPIGFKPASLIESNIAPSGLNENNEEKKIIICHDGTTMAVGSPSKQLTGHLAHGDTIGACEDDDPGEQVTDFSWLDTYLFDSGNTKIYPELTFDPSIDNNSGFFLLEQVSAGHVDFSAIVRAWKDVVVEEDGGETVTLHMEISWPREVPYDSKGRKKETYSMVFPKAPEYTVVTATYDDENCIVTKVNGGGYSTTVSEVSYNDDSTYTIVLTVEHDGCSGEECPALSHYSIEADVGNYSNVSFDGISGSLDLGPSLPYNSFNGFMQDNISGIGNGSAGAFTITYTLDNLQDQRVVAHGGGGDYGFTLTAADIDYVQSCVGDSTIDDCLDPGGDNYNPDLHAVFSSAIFNGSGPVDINSVSNVNITGTVRSETSNIAINSVDSFNINGHIEAKSDVTINGISGGTINGDIYSETSISIPGWITHNGTEYIASIGTRSLPTIPAPVDTSDPNYPQPITMITGDYYVNGSVTLNGTIFATGDIYVNSGQSISGAGAIVAGGNITCNSVSGLVGLAGADNGIFFYALTGDINLNSIDSATINGVVYAPNGNITFNSISTLTISGGVFAAGGATLSINSIDNLTIGPGTTYSHIIPNGLCSN